VADDARIRTLLDAISDSWRSRSGLRDAAVLAPLVERDGVERLLFTRRRDDLPHHAGQISFPGGVRQGGETPLSCALREAEEEIGVGGEGFSVLGALPERASSARFQVHVIVARLSASAVLRPDSREVAAVLEIPLLDLDDPARWQSREVVSGRRSPCFPFGAQLLWGLTARLTLDLLERLRREKKL